MLSKSFLGKTFDNHRRVVVFATMALPQLCGFVPDFFLRFLGGKRGREGLWGLGRDRQNRERNVVIW